MGHEVDLRDFQFMPLDVVRLRDSDFAITATGDEFKAGVLLWCAAWHQVPAGSLPDNDLMLASFAGYGRDIQAWAGVKIMALHGFSKGEDGRLYHSVICEKAAESWDKKNAQRSRTKAATEARRRAQEQRDVSPDDQRHDQRHDNRDDQHKSHQGTVKGQLSKGIGIEGAQDAPPPKKSSRKKGSRIPEDWAPDDKARTYAREHGLDNPTIEIEAEKFKNHWLAKTGANATKLDWPATWRTWVLNSGKFNGHGGAPPSTEYVSQAEKEKAAEAWRKQRDERRAGQ